MNRWARAISLTMLGAAVVLYAGDWLVYHLRGEPGSSVRVSHFLSAPLKNDKQELDYLGSEDVPCSASLFPQGSLAPCWYLRGHRNQVKSI